MHWSVRAYLIGCSLYIPDWFLFFLLQLYYFWAHVQNRHACRWSQNIWSWVPCIPWSIWVVRKKNLAGGGDWRCCVTYAGMFWTFTKHYTLTSSLILVNEEYFFSSGCMYCGLKCHGIWRPDILQKGTLVQQNQTKVIVPKLSRRHWTSHHATSPL